MLRFRNMIDLMDEDLDSRIVSFLNQSPVGDGGQWDMAVNILGMCVDPTGSNVAADAGYREVWCRPV